jgi:hypothetical protein
MREQASAVARLRDGSKQIVSLLAKELACDERRIRNTAFVHLVPEQIAKRACAQSVLVRRLLVCATAYENETGGSFSPEGILGCPEI